MEFNKHGGGEAMSESGPLGAGWPMYGHDSRRTCAARSLTNKTSKKEFDIVLPCFIVSDICAGSDGSIYFVGVQSPYTTRQNYDYFDREGHPYVVYCYEPDGTQRWSYQLGQLGTAGVRGPVLDRQGRLLIARGSELVALQTAIHVTERKEFSLSIPQNLGETASAYTIVLSSDGTSLFVILSNQDAWVVNLESAQPKTRVLSLSTVPQIYWAPAFGSDGLLYFTGGSLLGTLSADGKTHTLCNYDSTLDGSFSTGPVIADDGTVHAVVINQGSEQIIGVALYAWCPDGKVFRYPQTETDWKPLGSTSSETHPALTPDGDVVVAMDRLYKVAFDNKSGYREIWGVDDVADRTANVAVDGAGNIASIGRDNKLVVHDASGNELWRGDDAFVGAVPPLIIGPSGEVIVGCLNALVGYTGGYSSLISFLRQSLEACWQQVDNSWVYPLNDTSITDPALLSMVRAALGASQQTVGDGTITVDGDTLTLTGAGSYLDSNATLTLQFSLSSSAAMTLVATAAFDQPTTLSARFPGLADSPVAAVQFTDLTVKWSGSTNATATGWSVAGQTSLPEPLAALFDGSGTYQFSGTVTSTGDGAPEVDLTMTGTLTLGSAWPLPHTAITLSSVGFGISTTVTIGGQQVVLSAALPSGSDPLVLTFTTDKPLSVASVAELAFWPGADSAGLAACLPPAIASSGFGLKTVGITVAPTVSIALEFGMDGPVTWDVFQLPAPSVSFAITSPDVKLVIENPLGQTGYQVDISGQLKLSLGGASIDADVKVSGPNWDIEATVEDADLTPDAAIAFLGVSLPANAPTGSVFSAVISAQPGAGTFSVTLSSGESWTLFDTVSLDAFSVEVARVITPKPAITASVAGDVSLGGANFHASAEIGGGDLTFKLVPAGSALPLQKLVNGLPFASGLHLPEAIGEIALDKVVLALGDGSTTPSFKIDLSDNWTIIDSPFAVTLTGIKVAITETGGAANAQIDASLQLGDAATVAVQVPLTGNDGKIQISFAAGTGQSPPSIGGFVRLFDGSLAQALPSVLADLSLTALDIAKATATDGTETTSVTFTVQDTDATWDLLALPGFGLSDLAASGTWSSGTGITLTIDGTLGVKSVKIPLTGTIDRHGWSVGLNGTKFAASLTVGDLAGLADSGLAASLPSDIADFGKTVDITTFSLKHDDSGDHVDIAVACDDQGLSLTFDGFDFLAFTGYTLSLTYNAPKAPGWSGNIGLTGTLFDEPVTASASLPLKSLQGTMKLNDFNLGALSDKIEGASGGAASWASDVGVKSLDLTIAFRPLKITLSADLGTFKVDPDGLDAGTMKDVALEIVYASGSTSVCLAATWVTPVGVSIPGKICYPFNRYKPNDRKSSDDDDKDNDNEFPPKKNPPDKGNDDNWKQALEDAAEAAEAAAEAAAVAAAAAAATEAETDITAVLGLAAAMGLAGGLLRDGVGGSVTAVPLTKANIERLMVEAYYLHHADAMECCVGIFKVLEPAWSSSSFDKAMAINAIAAALAKVFGMDVFMAGSYVLQAAKAVKLALRPRDLVGGLASAFPSTPAAALMQLMAANDNNVTTPAALCCTMKECGFTATMVAPALLFVPSGSAATAAEVAAALQGGTGCGYALADIVTGLLAAGFPPAQTAAALAGLSPEVPAAVAAMAAGGLPSATAAAAFAGTGTAASVLASAVVAAYPGSDPSEAIAALAAAGISAAHAATYAYGTGSQADTIAAALIAAGYGAPVTLAAVMAAFPDVTYTAASASALLATAKVSPAGIAAAITAAGFAPSPTSTQGAEPTRQALPA